MPRFLLPNCSAQTSSARRYSGLIKNIFRSLFLCSMYRSFYFLISIGGVLLHNSSCFFPPLILSLWLAVGLGSCLESLLSPSRFILLWVYSVSNIHPFLHIHTASVLVQISCFLAWIIKIVSSPISLPSPESLILLAE